MIMIVAVLLYKRCYTLQIQTHQLTRILANSTLINVMHTRVRHTYIAKLIDQLIEFALLVQHQE